MNLRTRSVIRIAATNSNLRDAVARAAFREDLYYRLHVFDIQMPPLRERTRDIPLLVDAFLVDIGRAIGRAPAGVTPEAKDMLMKHAWPGNVRELRNALERAAILCEGGLITPDHLSLRAETIATSFDGATDLRSVERRAIDKALRETDGNKAKAARRLGLSRTQLYGRLRKYQIPEAARCGATPERVNCLRRSGDLHLDSENRVDASSNDS